MLRTPNFSHTLAVNFAHNKDGARNRERVYSELEEITKIKTDCGCVSLKKSKIGFLIRDHADSLFLKTRKIRKWIFFSISRNDPSMQFACFGGSFQNGGKFWFDV